MALKYRRSPWLFMEWGEGSRIPILDSRSRRKYLAEPLLVQLLNQISAPTEADRIQLPGYSAGDLARLLDRMVRVGMIQTVHDDDGDRPEWTASELGVQMYAAQGGKPKVSLRDIPPARLRHRNVMATIPLARADNPSRPLRDVLRSRRSIRDFDEGPLGLDRLGAFLDQAARVRGWLGPREWQTTRRPSASGGARHSIELYAIVRDVDGLAPGAYHYDPFDHTLEQLQQWLPEHAALQKKLLCAPMYVRTPPPVHFYLASYFRRVQCKYGSMTLSLIYRETGCLVQTLYLVATDMGLAPCATAATEAVPSPTFLREHRDRLLHTGNFALGVPATAEPTNPEFQPIGN